MAITFKNIGDTLTTNEFNEIVSLYRHFKTHTEKVTLEGVTVGEFGKYEFDANGNSIIDKGILFDNVNYPNVYPPKIRLSDNTFKNSNYILVITIFEYTGMNIFDDVTPSNYILKKAVEVSLKENVWINLPVVEGDIIGFDAIVKINHDKVVKQ